MVKFTIWWFNSDYRNKAKSATRKSHFLWAACGCQSSLVSPALAWKISIIVEPYWITCKLHLKSWTVWAINYLQIQFMRFGSHAIALHQPLCPCPQHTLRNNDVVITSKRRIFDVITSKWRRFDVITMLLLRHGSVGQYDSRGMVTVTGGDSDFCTFFIVREPADVYITSRVQKVWVVGCVNGPLQIPQWWFLSFPLRAFGQGVRPNWKWFKLHFRVHRWKLSKKIPCYTLIINVKFLNTGSGANII